MDVDVTTGLNKAQQEAVMHGNGPLLVLAGPGSGKTRVVTARIAHLIQQGVPSHSMLALTFTNKAAAEMASRISKLVPGNSVWVSTFHRLCNRLLRRYAELVGLDQNFTIYDTDDSLSLLKSVIDSGQVNTGKFTARQIAQAISRAKSDLVIPEDLNASSRPVDIVAGELMPIYQARMIAANAVDFDDLLLHVVRMLHENEELRRELDERFGYILVDEYQDTNLAQYGIVRGLSIDHPNLTVTGDPDQSIYAWRGANIENILRFEHDYPGSVVVRLEQNYRSTPNILQAADQLIAHNHRRKKKRLWTDNPEGKSVRLVQYETGQSEAEGIVDAIAAEVDAGRFRPRDFALLYRTNALSRNFEHAFRARGIPYQIVRGVEFYKRKEIKDVLAYLQLVNNPKDEIAMLRVVNAPPRGIGKVTLNRLKDYAATHGIALIEAAAEADFLASISKRPRTAIQEFRRQIDKLSAHAQEHDSVELLVDKVLTLTGYRDHLEASDSEEDRQRLANVEELATAALEFDEQLGDPQGLEDFLEQVALVNDTDDWEDEEDKVTLLTMHAAKGLEFPVVFIIALEAGILPHERSQDNPQQLEEERRLLFVGMTRAEQQLVTSYARRRDYRGRSRSAVPSMFLTEIRSAGVEFEQHGLPPWHDPNELSEHAKWRRQRAKKMDDDVPEVGFEPHAHKDETELRDEENSRDDFNSVDATQPTEPTTTKLVTAADLIVSSDPSEQPPPAPGDFAVGGLVVHPEHGPGKVIEASGTGKRQKVSVQFIQPPKKRTFQVAFSPLRKIESA